tara:strand:+ start:51 stop:227 length:177 start_codon:yes stop_codon:yes gene_type:complete
MQKRKETEIEAMSKLIYLTLVEVITFLDKNQNSNLFSMSFHFLYLSKENETKETTLLR